MARILFVYPNIEGYPIIPVSLSLMSGILKYSGHKVDLFDVTFLTADRRDHLAREKAKAVDKVDVGKYWGKGVDCDLADLFAKKIKEFIPDIIAFSVVENNYFCAIQLLDVAKKHSSAITVVGGLFPTIASQFFVDNKNVDMICIGEGEQAMNELAHNVDQGKNSLSISNMIIKRDGQITTNNLCNYYDWEPNTFQDWEIFDERHLLKPFIGKMQRTGFFEISRGCPFNCSYCINQICQKLFRGLGKYNRQKSIEYAIQEMKSLKKKYNLELIFFNDEHFMIMQEERLKEFCSQYKENISLPFFIMTRAENLLDIDNVRMIKDAGCHTIGIGVESGSERIRKSIMNKNISNDIYEEAFKVCHECGIRTTANIMVGLPTETEKEIMESVEFVKKLEARSISIAIFAPYYGTKLRDVCVEKGYMEDRLYSDIGIINNSILTMPQISKERIRELYFQFNELVYGSKVDVAPFEAAEVRK